MTLQQEIEKILIDNAEEPDDVHGIDTFETYRASYLINGLVTLFKSKFKEMIGEGDLIPEEWKEKDSITTYEMDKAHNRNELRSELRKKVEEL